MPLISRNITAYASSAGYPASNAYDGNYNNEWRSSDTIAPQNPAWIAYNLTSVPAAQRTKVLVAWHTTSTFNWDLSVLGDTGYNIPRDYTLEANTAVGATSAPLSGWVQLAKVTGNNYTSRQHLINLTGYNWFRMSSTSVNGSQYNFDVAINLDLHDASLGAQDSWLFLGDSITAFTMKTSNGGYTGLPSYGQLINASKAGFYPAQTAAGIGYTKTSDALANIDRWLAEFPGRYVCMSYGTNDVNANPAGVDIAYNNFKLLIQKITAAGKIACIPRMPWAPAQSVQANAPALNARIDQLYAQYPLLVRGPDLWSVFQNQPQLFQDDLHPNAAGINAYRRAWANTMLQSLYK